MDGAVHIRPERSEDGIAVRAIHERAFGGVEEANLVDALCAADAVTLSLVAEVRGALIGHLLLSAISIIGPFGTREAVALAPMAVLREHQRRGIGSRLLRTGLAELKVVGGAVVVLGHPQYYPRFGFVPVSRFSLRCQYEYPDEAYMALELRPETFPAWKAAWFTTAQSSVPYDRATSLAPAEIPGTQYTWFRKGAPYLKCDGDVPFRGGSPSRREYTEPDLHSAVLSPVRTTTMKGS